ncbi:MAG: ATP-binding protein [Candidatus Parabeggiatoa sp. nov. 2]|nr:MAG: chromosome segregation protein SMC [Beggiatoa sp. 4572_84]RKZ54256.1 MAG: ATP-binding protein [Gammaproteobacteria bacterium]
MKVKKIKVNNFKSLVDFECPLDKFNCLVGLNGSGKSTVLQAFDFLSQQVRGDIKGWLEKRQWKPSEIHSKLTSKQNINFEVLLLHANRFEVNWTASFNCRTLRCTSELIHWNQNLIFEVKNGEYRIQALNEQKSREPINFDYQGSLISQIKESQLTPEILEFKRFFEGLLTLDLLEPEFLKKPTRRASKSLGLGGEGLSAFLHNLEEKERDFIQDKISICYPNLKQFNVSQMRSGLKKLFIQEQFKETTLEIESRHIADGFLRLLAVFAQLSLAPSFLLLDEIENGINPELIEFLMDTLVEARPQVLITTHSPMVLNYIEDDIAIKGVVYLYKEPNGATQAVRLFDIPSLREKLTVMGPGEVYDDTLLSQLVEEITLLKNLKPCKGWL